MKYLILFLLTIQLFGYDFSKVVPQDSVGYISFNSPETFKKYLEKDSSKSFFNSKYYKELKKEVMSIIQENVDSKNQIEFKVFAENITKLVDQPFAVTVAFKQNIIKKNNYLDYAFWINGKEYKNNMGKMISIIKKNPDFSKHYKYSKKSVKGVELQIFESKIGTKGDMVFVYGVVKDNIIIASSLEYMKKLISYSKNSSLPKLKNLATYFKYKKRYKRIIGEMFLNINLIMQYTQKVNKADLKAKKYLQSLDVDDVKAFFGVVTLTPSKEMVQTFHLINEGAFPKFLKTFVTKRDNVDIPSFLPPTTTSFIGFKFDLAYLWKTIKSSLDDKDKQNADMLGMMLGVSPDSLFEALGDKFNFVSVVKNDKIQTIFYSKLNDEKILFSTLKRFEARIGLKLNERPYLNGKLYDIIKPAEFSKMSIGYKNKILIIARTETVKEIMQIMSGKSQNFKSKKLYRKVLKNKHNNQSLLQFSDQAVTMYHGIKDYKKTLLQKLKKDTKNKKMNKHIENIYKILSKVTLKEWKTYFGYNILEVFPERNDIIILGKTIKR